MAISQQPTIKQLETTNKVYKLRQESNDNDLASKLKLSKVTLYTRLSISNWTPQETLFVEYVSNPEFKKTVDSLKILD
jgi:hypothetical protein